MVYEKWIWPQKIHTTQVPSASYILEYTTNVRRNRETMKENATVIGASNRM